MGHRKRTKWRNAVILKRLHKKKKKKNKEIKFLNWTLLLSTNNKTKWELDSNNWLWNSLYRQTSCNTEQGWAVKGRMQPAGMDGLSQWSRRLILVSISISTLPLNCYLMSMIIIWTMRITIAPTSYHLSDDNWRAKAPAIILAHSVHVCSYGMQERV